MYNALVMFHGLSAPRGFPVSKDEVVIGRGEACELRVPLGSVSRKHCKVIFKPQLRVEDMGSSNGTFVNGRRVNSLELEPGDSIQVGPVVFVVQVEGLPPVEEMSPIRAESQAIAVSPIDGSHPDNSPTIQSPD